MDKDEGSKMGPSKRIKKAFKRTMVKLKSTGHSSAQSASGDTGHHHLQTSRPEPEEVSLRPSEDEVEPQQDPVDTGWARVSVHSGSPHLPPDSPLPFERPKGPPPQQRTRSSSRGTEEFLKVEASESGPSSSRAQPSAKEDSPDVLSLPDMGGHDGTQETGGDSKEREEIHALLSDKLKQGQNFTDVGEFLVSNYWNCDSALDGQVTRMVADQVPEVVIASRVLYSLGLNPPPLGFPGSFSPHSTPSNSISLGSAGVLTDPAVTRWTVTTSTQDQESSLGMGTAVRHPVSTKNIIPYRPPAATSISLSTHFGSASETRGPLVPLVAPRPRRHAPIFPHWTESGIARSKRDLDAHEADLSRREEESSNEALQAAERANTPILRPATAERVKRGYYDDELDEGGSPADN